MKKFSELTDSDFDYLNKDNINTLSRKMIHNTKRKEVIKSYKNVYEAIKDLKDKSRAIIVCIIKSDKYIVNISDIYSSFKDTSEMEKFKESLYLLDVHDINEMETMIECENDFTGMYMLFTEGNIYVDEQFYFLKQYKDYRLNSNIINNENRFSWLGKMSDGQIVEKVLSDLSVNCITITRILGCTVKKLNIIDRHNCILKNCRIKSLCVHPMNTYIMVETTNCIIDEMIIDLTEYEDAIRYIIDVNTSTIKNLKVNTTKKHLDKTVKVYGLKVESNIIDVKGYTGEIEIVIV